MTDFLGGVLIFILRVVDFVLDVAVAIDRMKRLARYWTGTDRLVEVPADPKFITPEAQRALAEAEARRASIPSS